MQISKRQKHLIIAIAIVLMAIVLNQLHHSESTHSAESARQKEGLQQAIQREMPERPHIRRDRDTGEIIWRVGKPKPALPVVRGANNQRQFGKPVARKLPDVIEGSTPAVMAMIPADGRQELLTEEIDVDTLRSRRMVLDTEALERVLAGDTNHLLAPTPGSEVLDLKADTILTRSEQTHSIRGKIAGEELSDFSIVYHDGIIHGSVSRYEVNQHFEYRILPDGHMMVREIDMTTLVENCGNTAQEEGHQCGAGCVHDSADKLNESPPDVGSETGPTIESDTSGWTTVDVVVGYGALARSTEGGVSQIEARIIDSVDDMNAAFVNSLVSSSEIMLLGTIEDPDYVFPGDDPLEMGSADELGDLSNGSDGSLDTVTDFATTLGSDLIAFICNASQDGTAGIAQRPGRYSVTARTALSPSLTFSHELGHNLGARHSLGDSGDMTTTTARFGLRFEGSGGGLYRTIMAYNNSSTDSTPGTYSASRVPHFANPNVSYDGTPTGAADGSDFGNNSHPLFGLVDPVYESNGFDGTNASLGARNAEMFLVVEGSNGVANASGRSTRTPLGVTSPTIGVTWPAGTSQTISYTGGDMEYTADIDLYKGGVYQYTIASNIEPERTRYYTWDIPLAQEGGNDFQIRVTLTHVDTSATSFAESDFFVIQGTTDIILESPIGGETWTRNTVQNITWSSSYGGNVEIQYIKGAASPVTIAASTPDDGSYEWTIPFDLATGTDYKIKITSDVSPFDNSQSAANFTIVAPSNELLVTNLNSDPGFTTAGEFEYGAPQAGNGASSPNTGTNMYDTNLSATSFGYSSLTTYAIDCTNHTNITLEFWAYIMVWDLYAVKWEISTDNSNWTTLDTIGTGVQVNQSWTKYTYDITSYAAGEPTVYVRWSMDGTGSQMTSGGLSIDDISITGDFIPADGINLASPKGGEIVTPQYLWEITWLSGIGGNVKIELLKNNALHSTITSSTANDGLFYWTPSGSLPLSNDYKIRVTSIEQSSRTGESTTNFTISNDSVPAAVDAPTLSFNLTGNANWFPQTATTHDGVDAAQSGAITHDQLSSLETTFTTSGTLTFWWKVSSEETFDFMRFFLNGTQQAEVTAISGNSAWIQESITIPSGTNTVRWTYEKDGSVSRDSDCGWVDEIVFTPDVETFAMWGSGVDFSDDANNDGISNGIAWLLGAANPTSSMSSNRPVVSTSSNDLMVTFSCLNAANRGSSVLFLEHSTDLGVSDPWSGDSVTVPESTGSVGGISFSITPNGTMNNVQATIPGSEASGGKIFGRIRASGP